MAEQRKAAEDTKTKELARQIQQEREREEFDRLAGKKTHLDRGIDWMYQGHAAGDSKPSALEEEDASKRAEEYLLGKEYAPEGSAAAGDFTQGSASEGVNAVVKLEPARPDAKMAAAAASSSGPAYAEPSVADRNEAFRQRVEDPMFMVSQKEREKREETRKQQALYERVMGPAKDRNYDPDANNIDKKKKSKKHERKREHKERRRHEKESRKSRKRHSYRSDEGEDEARYQRKRHSRHDGDDDDDEGSIDHRYSRRYDSDEDSDRDRHPRSRKRSRSRDRSGKDHESNGHRQQRRRSRSPDDSRSRHYQQSRDYERQRSSNDYNDRHRAYHHSREDSSAHHKSRSGGERQEDHGPTKPSGYGLQRKSSSSYSSNPRELGPNQELLRQKRESAEEDRRRAKDRASSRRSMTAEERAKALHEMQSTAEQRQKQANSRTKTYGEEDDTHADGGNARFLQDMREQTHGLKGPVKSMASRIAGSRNTQQRLHNDSFL